MTYHVRGFMAFGPNDRCYVLNHDIVCDAMPILCTHVDLGIENNVEGGSFPFRRTENPFSERKKGSFCETTTKILFQNATVLFF